MNSASHDLNTDGLSWPETQDRCGQLLDIAGELQETYNKTVLVVERAKNSGDITRYRMALLEGREIATNIHDQQLEIQDEVSKLSVQARTTQNSGQGHIGTGSCAKWTTIQPVDPFTIK